MSIQLDAERRETIRIQLQQLIQGIEPKSVDEILGIPKKSRSVSMTEEEFLGFVANHEDYRLVAKVQTLTGEDYGFSRLKKVDFVNIHYEITRAHSKVCDVLRDYAPDFYNLPDHAPKMKATLSELFDYCKTNDAEVCEIAKVSKLERLNADEEKMRLDAYIDSWGGVGVRFSDDFFLKYRVYRDILTDPRSFFMTAIVSEILICEPSDQVERKIDKVLEAFAARERSPRNAAIRENCVRRFMTISAMP